MESSATSSVFSLMYIIVAVGIVIVAVVAFCIYLQVNKCRQRRKARRDLENQAQGGEDFELGLLTSRTDQLQGGRRGPPVSGESLDRSGRLRTPAPIAGNSSISGFNLPPSSTLRGLDINYRDGSFVHAAIPDHTLSHNAVDELDIGDESMTHISVAPRDIV